MARAVGECPNSFKLVDKRTIQASKEASGGVSSALVATATTSEAAARENVERLHARVAHDHILDEMTNGRKLAIGPTRLTPSGVDLVACALACSIFRGDDGVVGLALPRGQHGLAAIVGAYLARVGEGRGRPGSVSVLTRSPSLREAAASLRVPKRRFGEGVSVCKLGTLSSGARVRPAAVSYANSRDRRGISQADHHLLFQLPHVAPPIAYNVISIAVVDAASSSRDSWEQTSERNRRARRRQVWIGELGDADFASFCDEQRIPVFRFDWETIAACATLFGCGGGPLTSGGLCAAAGGPLGPAFQVCNQARFNEELRGLHWRLAEIRRRAKPEPGEEKPAPLRAAEQLASLFGRIAFPVDTFDAATAFAWGVRSSANLLQRVENAPSAPFRGRWKEGYNSHWGAVKGAARALRAIATEECPKWWAVCCRVEEARTAGEGLRIVCQTQADQAALAEALVAEGVLAPSALGEWLEIVTFAQRDEQGGDDDRATLYLAPPPPWRASVYLTGERGRAEVLVYPTQVWQLRSAFARTWESATDHAANAAVLSLLGFPGVEVGARLAPPPPLVELEQVALDETRTTEDDYTDAAGHEHVRALLEEMVLLYGEEVDGEEAVQRERAARAVEGTVAVRRLRFREGPTLIVGADDLLDVVWTAGGKGAAKVLEKPVADIQPGQRVLVLPGSKRGSLLQEYMASWDRRLGPIRFVYQNRWQRALEAAAATVGRAGLASQLGVTEGTVDGWLDPQRGAMWPQQRRWMREILRLSNDPEAWENRAPIIRYIERTRGTHRHIGRLLNRAVTEVITGGDKRWTRQLERLVGRTLEDELAAARLLTVGEVGPPEELPYRLIGLFIDPDDPDTKGLA